MPQNYEVIQADSFSLKINKKKIINANTTLPRWEQLHVIQKVASLRVCMYVCREVTKNSSLHSRNEQIRLWSDIISWNTTGKHTKLNSSPATGMALLRTVSQCFYKMNFILCQEQKALEAFKAFANVSMPITTFICQFWDSYTEGKTHN